MKYHLNMSSLLFCTVFFFNSLSSAAPSEVKVNPKSLELNEKGAVAMQAHDNEGAEKLFKQAYDIDPSNITAAYNLAGSYVANKKESEAIKLLSGIAKSNPKDAGIYARLGDAHFSNQNVNEARNAYEKAYALDSNYPSIPMKLGVIYSMNNKLNKAEKMLEKAVEQNPEDSKTLANLASVLLANKKPEEAIRAAKKSLQGKVAADTYITLGQSYDSIKEAKNALISYEKAMALGKSTPELLTRVKELKEFVAKQG